VSGWLSNCEAWIEAHPGDAAWVQAIGATLAVATAVLVPALQARNARRQREAEQRLRAKSLAIAIYPELLHIRIAYRRIGDRLLARSEEARRPRPPRTADMHDADPAEQPARLSIPISDALRGMVPQFYLLGEPIGPAVQKCIGRSMKYNDIVHGLAGSPIEVGLPKWLHFIETGLTEVEACLASIEQSWGLSADDARAFEDEFAGAIETVPAPRRRTISKETV